MTLLVVLRFASATAYLFVVSGWLVLAAFYGPRKFRLLDVVGLSFVTSLALTSLLAVAAQLAGLGLDAVLYGHLAVTMACGVVAAVRGAGDVIEPLDPRRRRWEIAAVVIVGTTALLAWAEGLWLRMSDLFYHIAAVASLLTSNQPLVTDPMFGVRDLPVDPTSGTFHTFLALVAKLGGISAFQSFEWLEPVVVAAYFLVFFAFARRMLASAPKAVFALALFAGVVWQLDFRVVIYSKWLDPAVFWAGLVFLLALMERFDWRALVLTSVFAVTTAMVHLATAELWFFAALALVAWSLVLVRRVEDGKGVLARCALGAGVSLGVLAPVVWRRSVSVLAGAQTSVFNPAAGSPMSDLPYLPIGNSLGIIRGGTWYQWYQGGDLMLAFVVVAIVVLVARAVRRGAEPRTVMLLAAGSIMPALMLNLFWTKLAVAKYWFHLRRMAYVLRFIPALLLPETVHTLRDELRARASRTAVVPCVVAVLLGTLAFAGVEAIGVFGRFINPLSLDNFGRQRHNVATAMEPLVGYLAQHSRPTDAVAAHEKTSYYLAGLVPMRIIAVRRPHMPLAVEVVDGARRRHDQAQILNSAVTPGKTARLLAAYNVRYVVTAAGSSSAGKFARMGGLRAVYDDGRYVVFATSRPRNST